MGSTTGMDAKMKDVLLIRLNYEGDTLWTKIYGGIYNDEGRCVQQTRDSGFLIAGLY
ncbi:MAG: hypothetical protein IPP29_18450 [Bacteroidetes bacterium]|nr:hypothetical protein [Bacteroidota bacterium]